MLVQTWSRPTYLPTGAWVDTCSPLSWTGQVLTASCSSVNKNTKPIHNVLPYSDLCAPSSQLSNVDGYLTCGTLQPSIPTGSWVESCSIVAYKSNLLTADCPAAGNHRGYVYNRVRTTLNYSLCASGSQVSNNNGALGCGSYTPEVPGGSWLNSCSIYSLDLDSKVNKSESQLAFI